MASALLFEIGVVVLSATFLAIIARGVKQPLIPAYIIAGILIGPEYLSIIKDEALIRVLSELGIAFLLFTTGLELDIEKIRRLGKSITFISLFQILITFTLGYALSLHLGFNPVISVYIGFLLAFSSTMIVIKLSDEYNQLSTLHGRIVLGILLMQDIVAVAILSMLTQTNVMDISVFVQAFITAAGFISIAVILGKYILPPIIKKLSKDTELLFLFSLSVLFIFSIASYFLDFSVSIGAFLAGISLAIFPYNIEIAGSVRSLRDFFSVVFFVSLGMELKLGVFSTYSSEIIALSLFVIALKPVIIYFLTSMFNYERKTSFLSGIYLGQTSEFSLIIAGTAAALGKLPETIFVMIVAVTLVTMSATPYMIRYSFTIFRNIERVLSKLDKILYIHRKYYEEEVISRIKRMKNHVIICGAHITGRRIIEHLIEKDIPFVVIDFDPDVVEKLSGENLPVLYGDITHPEVLEYANIHKAKILVSTVPDIEDNLFVITYAKDVNKDVTVMCTAENIENAMKFYCAGADFVSVPKLVAGERLFSIIEKLRKNPKELEKLKKEYLRMIEKEEMKEKNAGFELICEIKKKILEA